MTEVMESQRFQIVMLNHISKVSGNKIRLDELSEIITSYKSVKLAAKLLRKHLLRFLTLQKHMLDVSEIRGNVLTLDFVFSLFLNTDFIFAFGKDTYYLTVKQ